jgi:hypothetical protein
MHMKLIDSDHASLTKLHRVIKLFRDVHLEITSSYIDTFMAVARRPGLTVAEYSELVGHIQPVTSRMLLDLGPRTREGKEGLLLIRQVRSKTDLRMVTYTIAPKGARLLMRILRELA